jgi:hypothetical protein
MINIYGFQQETRTANVLFLEYACNKEDYPCTQAGRDDRHGLLSSFTGMMAAAYSDLKTTGRSVPSRSMLITRQFRAGSDRPFVLPGRLYPRHGAVEKGVAAKGL